MVDWDEAYSASSMVDDMSYSNDMAECQCELEDVNSLFFVCMMAHIPEDDDWMPVLFDDCFVEYTLYTTCAAENPKAGKECEATSDCPGCVPQQITYVACEYGYGEDCDEAMSSYMKCAEREMCDESGRYSVCKKFSLEHSLIKNREQIKFLVFFFSRARF